jgi:hypothetical protein
MSPPPRAAKSSILIHIAGAAIRRMMTGISAVWTLSGAGSRQDVASWLLRTRAFQRRYGLGIARLVARQ